MALIKCPECRKKISDQCVSCPNCGYPIKDYLETECSDEEYIDDREQESSQKEIRLIKTFTRIVIILVTVLLVSGAVLLFIQQKVASPNNGSSMNSNQPIVATTTNATTISDIPTLETTTDTTIAITTANPTEEASTTNSTIESANETSVTNNIKDRRQEAVSVAVYVASTFFPTDRNYLREFLLNPGLIEGIEPFTPEEAEYAILYANIDWSLHLQQLLTEYLMAVPVHTTPKTLVQNALYPDMFFTAEEMELAVRGCNVDWVNEAYYYMDDFNKYIPYSWCANNHKVLGQNDSCPVCNAKTDIFQTYRYTEAESRTMLVEQGFNSYEINAAIDMCLIGFFFSPNNYINP